MALGASCCPFANLWSLLNQSRWRYQTGSLNSPQLLSMAFQMFLWPLHPCRAQHILSSRFSSSALPHCTSHCHKHRSRVLRALWGLFNRPGPTILPIPALQSSNQSWTRATPPRTDLLRHGAQVMPKPKARVAFPFKN